MKPPVSTAALLRGQVICRGCGVSALLTKFRVLAGMRTMVHARPEVALHPRIPLLLALIAALAGLGPAPAPAAESGQPHFVVTELRNDPVIGQDHPDVRGNTYGFEDGVTVKIDGVYHLIVCEMNGDPLWVKMRIAHWVSGDAVRWRRVATLRETSGQLHALTGLPYDSVWGSNAVYDEGGKRWNLFYVGYEQGGTNGGTIRRAVSDTPGKGGIGGPYRDVEITLRPDAASQPWEGDQGTDSFYPYRVNGRWLAFYGSHASERFSWEVGLASAPKLAGPWHRLPHGNPVPIEPIMVENPIVTALPDGRLAAVYDTDVTGPKTRETHDVGVSFSTDGLTWSKGGRITVQPDGPANWTKCMRTPLGLVPEGGNRYTLLYTAESKTSRFWPVGMVRVELKR